MAATDFSRQLRLTSHTNNSTNGTDSMVLFAASTGLSDCESPDSISVQTKQHLPLGSAENRRHRLDPEQRRKATGSVDDNDEIVDDDDDDEGEEEDDEEEEDNDDDDDDEREGANDNDHHTDDILAQFNDDQTAGMNDSTNLQDCIDALDGVIEQVPSYHIYNGYAFGDSIHDTSSSNNTNNNHTTHLNPIVHQHNTTANLGFDHNTLYNYSSLDCFIVHPELIHPQIHDPILHHHTSSTSLSYSLLDSFDISPNDVARVMDSVASDTINDIATGDCSVRKEDHVDRYFPFLLDLLYDGFGMCFCFAGALFVVFL